MRPLALYIWRNFYELAEKLPDDETGSEITEKLDTILGSAKGPAYSNDPPLRPTASGILYPEVGLSLTGEPPVCPVLAGEPPVPGSR